MSSRRLGELEGRSVKGRGAAPARAAAVPAPSRREPVDAVESGAAPVLNPDAPSHDEIARAAYERWLERGGDAVENWLAAEADLRARRPLPGDRAIREL